MRVMRPMDRVDVWLLGCEPDGSKNTFGVHVE